MYNLEFSITFDKYLKNKKKMIFSQGLHIVYGESGVGKSHFLESFLDSKSDKKNNFIIESQLKFEDAFIINQNPDTQLVCRTVQSELAFNGECLQRNHNELDKYVHQGLDDFPGFISKEMNPGFLSGGEKELLNIITATQLKRKILMIDDGLSFLSEENKIHSITLLKDWSTKNNGIIIWCTSDYDDLKYKCDGKWILNKNLLKIVDEYEPKNHSALLNPEGYLNIKIDNLKFNYEDGRVIFNNYSINIENTRCLGLLGNNGSGKTTLAGLCFGDLKPLEGTIRLLLGKATKLRVGYLDQFPENLLLLTKLDDFLMRLKKLNLLKSDQIDSIKEKLMIFNIKWHEIKFLNSIQISWVVLRITLIVILAHCSFQVLILDEPSFGLGWNQRVLLRSFLKEFMINKHFIIVSHDKKFSNSLCDKVIDFDVSDIQR